MQNYKYYCKIKAIVFDLDGTLIDTMKYFGKVASQVMNKYYGVPIDEAKKLYFETSGVPFFQQLEIIFPGDSRNEKAANEYEKRKLKFFFSEHFSPELLKILREIRKKFPDFIIAVSSNNFEHLVKEYMRKNNLDVFDEVLGYRENFAKGKDHFKYLMDKYNLKGDEIVFIGDSWWDAKVAIDNGVKFIALTRTFPRNEWEKKFPNILVVDNFNEIIYFLEEVSKCRQ